MFRGLPCSASPGCLVAAVEHLGDVVEPFGARGGIPRCGAQIDVPEASRDLMDRNAGLQAVGGPVRPERVGVRKTIRDPGGQTVTADQAVDGLCR
jgi:hypothetical protein